MNRQHKVILASVLLSTTSFVSLAGPMPPPPGPPPPVGLPIDGFVFYGVIIALAYGVKKIIGFNKK